MTVAEFVAEDWIDRLALALQGMAEAQEPYLCGNIGNRIRVCMSCP